MQRKNKIDTSTTYTAYTNKQYNGQRTCAAREAGELHMVVRNHKGRKMTANRTRRLPFGNTYFREGTHIPKLSGVR